jgi:hypothetical protein
MHEHVLLNYVFCGIGNGTTYIGHHKCDDYFVTVYHLLRLCVVKCDESVSIMVYWKGLG